MVELLFVTAFVLTVIAVIVLFTWRWQAMVLANPINQSAVQLDAAMDGSQAFEAAIAASQEARRARISRTERNRKVLIPVAFGLSGLTGVCALAALFLAGDREAATVCAVDAVILLFLTAAAYLSAKHASQKARRLPL